MPEIALDIERQLLLQIAAGDTAAFSQLFHKYHHVLGIYIYRLTASREMAEEVTKDIFLKLWAGREKLTEVHTFSTWLFSISRNHALNALKKVISEQTLQKEWEEEFLPAHTAESFNNIEVYNLLEQAILHLPAQQKKVFVLSRFHRLRYRDIAQQLDLSSNTVKCYLRIATDSISQYMTSRLS